ncbi:MAG TPA: ArsB/NhaD family transporter, partial [Chloroflexota bacterium]
ALAIFAATLCGVLARPFKVSEGAWAMGGAALMLVTGLASLGDLGSVLAGNLPVFAFFLGMMALTRLAEEGLVFDRMAMAAARLAHGGSRRLFLNVFLLGTVISTFLTNDATALILTPVVYALVTRLRLDPLPFAFACTFIADTASMTLPVSNPINIILGQRFPDLTLGGFLHYILLPSLAAIAINIVAFTFIFRRTLAASFTVPTPTETPSAEAARAFRVAVIVLLLVALAFVAVSLSHSSWVGVVAMIGAGVLLLATALQGRLQWRRLAGGISWGVFPFIAGMFLLVRGIEHQGATHQLGLLLARLAGHGTMQTAVVTTFFSAIGSNVINNVPMVAVMGSAIPSAPGASHPALVYGTLVGCDLGPNLTIVGSLSTLIWLLLLRKRGVEVSSLDYAKLGIIVTPIMLLVSGLLLGVLLR